MKKGSYWLMLLALIFVVAAGGCGGGGGDGDSNDGLPGEIPVAPVEPDPAVPVEPAPVDPDPVVPVEPDPVAPDDGSKLNGTWEIFVVAPGWGNSTAPYTASATRITIKRNTDGKISLTGNGVTTDPYIEGSVAVKFQGNDRTFYIRGVPRSTRYSESIYDQFSYIDEDTDEGVEYLVQSGQSIPDMPSELLQYTYSLNDGSNNAFVVMFTRVQ